MNDVIRPLRGAVLAVAVVTWTACGAADDAALDSVPPVASSSPTTAATTPGTTTTVASPPVAATTTTTSTTTTTTTVAPPDDRFAGVVVATGQRMSEPYPQWFVVDLTDDELIEASPRALVEVLREEISCGDLARPYGAWRIMDGDSVTFGLDDVEAGAPPEYWFPGEESFAGPSVRGRAFRVPCPAGTEQAVDDVADARARWEANGPASYEFSLGWYIFNQSYGDYRIRVVDGEPVSIERQDDLDVGPDGFEYLPKSVDAIFDELERMVAADSFVGDFDPELGFPVSVQVDVMRDAVDDELEVRIDDFVVTDD